jgi:hypothetical protein
MCTIERFSYNIVTTLILLAGSKGSSTRICVDGALTITTSTPARPHTAQKYPRALGTERETIKRYNVRTRRPTSVLPRGGRGHLPLVRRVELFCLGILDEPDTSTPYLVVRRVVDRRIVRSSS